MAGEAQGLTDFERAIYEWQLWIEGFGEAGQERLRSARVLVSRCGGVGSVVAYELAAAGVGHLVLAHGGNLKASDLNRQLLMRHSALGRSRVETAAERLREFHPWQEITAVAKNLDEELADRLVAEVDLVVDCAPLFEERLAMNRASVRHGKVQVECAMYAMEAQLTTIRPGVTPCLACWCPEPPTAWRRQFPVFGAVSGSIGSLAAMEAVKVLAGLGEPLYGRMLFLDLGAMRMRSAELRRREDCAVCRGAAPAPINEPRRTTPPPPPDPSAPPR